MIQIDGERGSLSKRLLAIFLITPFWLLLPACAFILGDEEKMDFESLPANIQQLASVEIGSNQIVEVERERRYGKTIYAINYLVGEDEWEIEYLETGVLIDKALELDNK